MFSVSLVQGGLNRTEFCNNRWKISNRNRYVFNFKFVQSKFFNNRNLIEFSFENDFFFQAFRFNRLHSNRVTCTISLKRTGNVSRTSEIHTGRNSQQQYFYLAVSLIEKNSLNTTCVLEWPELERFTTRYLRLVFRGHGQCLISVPIFDIKTKQVVYFCQMHTFQNYTSHVSTCKP